MRACAGSKRAAGTATSTTDAAYQREQKSENNDTTIAFTFILLSSIDKIKNELL